MSQQNTNVHVDAGEPLYTIHASTSLSTLQNISTNIPTELSKALNHSFVTNKVVTTQVIEALRINDLTFTINGATNLITIIGVPSLYLESLSWDIIHQGLLIYPDQVSYAFNASQLNLKDFSLTATFVNVSTKMIASNLIEPLFHGQYNSKFLIVDMSTLVHAPSDFIDPLLSDYSAFYTAIIRTQQSFDLHGSLIRLKDRASRDTAAIIAYYTRYFPIDTIGVSNIISYHLADKEADLSGAIAYIMATALPIVLIVLGLLLIFMGNFQVSASSGELLFQRGLSTVRYYFLLVAIDFTYLTVSFLISSVLVYLIIISLHVSQSLLTNIVLLFAAITTVLMLIRVIIIFLNLKKRNVQKVQASKVSQTIVHRLVNRILLDYQKISYLLLGAVGLLFLIRYFLLSQNILMTEIQASQLAKITLYLTLLVLLLVVFHSFSSRRLEGNSGNHPSKQALLNRLHIQSSKMYRGVKFLVFISFFFLLFLPSLNVVTLDQSVNSSNGIYQVNDRLTMATLRLNSPINITQLDHLSNTTGILDISPIYSDSIQGSANHHSFQTTFVSIHLYNSTSLLFDAKSSYESGVAGSVFEPLRKDVHNVLISYDFARKTGIRIGDKLDVVSYTFGKLTVSGYLKDYQSPDGVYNTGIYISDSLMTDYLKSKNQGIRSSMFQLLYDHNLISTQQVKDLIATDDSLPSSSILYLGFTGNPYLQTSNSEMILFMDYLIYLAFCIVFVYLMLNLEFRTVRQGVTILLTRGAVSDEIEKTLFSGYRRDMTYIIVTSFSLFVSFFLQFPTTSGLDLYLVSSAGGLGFLGLLIILTTIFFGMVLFGGYWYYRTNIRSLNRELIIKGDIYEFY